jgi:hypothetical protein
MQRAARKVIQAILLDPTPALAKITPHPFSHAYGSQVTFETILQHNREGVDLVSLLDGTQLPPASAPKINPLREFIKEGHYIQNSSISIEKKSAVKDIPIEVQPEAATMPKMSPEEAMLDHIVQGLQYNLPRGRSLRDAVGIAAKPSDREGGHFRMSSIDVARVWIEKKENQADHVVVSSRRPRRFQV